MRLALRLAERGYGDTSPNPMVGAVLVRKGRIIGQGWHRQAGQPHAEIEALKDAARKNEDPIGATMYVTLEPCCTHGRTPPCTEAIKAAGITRVVAAATDPNRFHHGRGFRVLQKAGINVSEGLLAGEAEALNRAFNHWIVHCTPFVTVKAAMTLDGKIATPNGESKWITGEAARQEGMRLRSGVDAVLVGINTILNDDPNLTIRPKRNRRLRRVVLDSLARTPVNARVVSDDAAKATTIVISKLAPRKKVAALEKRVRVLVAPLLSSGPRPQLDLRWLLKRLGKEDVTSLLVEGGGEVNASFLMQGLAQQVAFFYAPKVLGGLRSIRGVAGEGAAALGEVLNLGEPAWKQLGQDWLMTAKVCL